MVEALFTRFTSHSGPLAKVLSLTDGKLTKHAAAQMVRGQFETLSLGTTGPGAAHRLATMLQGWKPTQALSPSLALSGAVAGDVVTQKALAANVGAVARDTKHFGYRAGVAGLLVLDYDPPKGRAALSPADLWAALLTLWPEAGRGIVCHWFSGSSLIFDGDAQMACIGGQRLYVVIQSQSDIPRTLSVLNKRAWLQGLGAHIHVSSAGALLTRSLFDSAMGDAGGRLDFAPAGAACRDGLEQHRGAPTVLADGGPLDTRTTLPDLSAAEEAEVRALIDAAKLRAQPEADAKRAAWLADRQQGAAIEAAKAGVEPEEARQRIRREHEALLSGVLMGSAELIHVTEEGQEVLTTVQALLKDPKHWHLKRFLSPHEPAHRGRSPDAIAYLLQAVPVIFDLNDSVTYRLQAQPVRLQATPGNKAQLADLIAAELATRPDLFTVAGQLVRPVAGEFVAVIRPLLSFLIGTHCALYRSTRDGKAAALDVDQPVVEMVLALLVERARKIKGRSSIPMIDAHGRVIEAQGLDDATGFYLETIAADAEPIPTAPTRTQTVAALRRLWKPWALYEWTTPHCCAAMLATVLTVPLRPTIDATPGLFADGVSQGAGKSAAIAAVLALIQGHRAGMKTWTGDAEAEIEKYLLALARSGAAAVAYDNTLGTFDSATIATAVIEGRVSARLLGSNTALAPTFRAMWLASGNNASLGRDCGTRFLQARIACPDGQPHRKSFPYEPSEAALADRMGIVRAILTVHRAWHAAGCPQPPDGISTRFPVWGRTVRAMVLWLSSSGLAAEADLSPLGDPADSILNREASSDPDTENTLALFAALADNFGTAQPFTARDVGTLASLGRDSSDAARRSLWDAVSGFFPRGAPSAQALTSMLRNRRDRVLEGLRLVAIAKGERREDRRAGQLFAVVEAWDTRATQH